MRPSDIPWRHCAEENDIRLLRSLLPVVRAAVKAMEDGTSGETAVEFASHGDENFSALEFESRPPAGSRSKILRIRILCDHDAIGRTYQPTEDDPCGEIADGLLMIRILEAICLEARSAPEPEAIDRDELVMRVNGMGVPVEGMVALTVERTPLGHQGLHLVHDDDARAHDDPAASDPEYLKEPGRIDIGIQDTSFGTSVRIAPMTRIHAVGALDALGMLRLAEKISSRRKA